MDVGCPGGSFDFLPGGIRLGIADILRDGAVKEEGILKHRRNIMPQAFQGHTPDILSVDHDTALSRVIEPGDQLGGGGFAHTGGANQGHHHAGLAVKGHILQHGNAVAVMEADILKGDTALGLAQVLGIGSILDGRRRFQDQRHTLCACQGLLQVLQQIGQAGHRGIKQGQVQHEGHDILHAQLPPVGQEAAEKHHQHRSGGGQEFHRGVKYRAGPEGPKHGRHLLKVLHPDPLTFVALLAEGLDLVQARQAVLQLGIQLAHALLGSPEEGPDDFGKYHTGSQDQRNGGAGNQRQAPVDGQENGQNTAEGHDIGDHFRNHVGIQQLKIPGVVDHTAHQVAGLLVMEEAKVQTLELVIQPAAQIAHQIPGRFVGQIAAQKAEKDPQQIQHQQRQGQLHDCGQGGIIHSPLHHAGHGGQHLGGCQIHKGQGQGGQNGHHIEHLVPGGFPGQFP